jgi:alpha-galactosidase
MAEALNSTGRHILYGMCNWGEDYPWKWAQTVANSWRISGDITDSFDAPDIRCPCTGDQGIDCALPGFHCSMMNILNKVSSFVDKGIPGAWNDLDMLEVGNGGMTDSQYRLHFTMWAAVKSPLLMGNDIRVLDAKSFSILTNPAVLAISQDPAGSAAVRRWRYYVNGKDRYDQGEIQMWSGSLDQGDFVVVLLNAARGSRHMNATLADIFSDYGGDRSDEASMSWDLYDLWANRMDDDLAAKIVAGNMTSTDWKSKSVSEQYFNATKLSYEKGLAKNSTILNGKWVETVPAHGRIDVKVGEYDIAAYRLKPKKSTQKDEL